MSPLTELITGAKAYGWSGFVSLTAFESIASTTLNNNTTPTVTFDNISSAYQHLQIRILGRSSTASSSVGESLNITINNDTGANYSYHTLSGDGSAVTSAVTAAGTASASKLIFANFYPRNAALSSTYGVTILDIHDYASTSKYKTVRGIDGTDVNTTTGKIHLVSGLWQSTSAITRIDLAVTSNNWATGSTFALYGIKGAA